MFFQHTLKINNIHFHFQEASKHLIMLKLIVPWGEPIMEANNKYQETSGSMQGHRLRGHSTSP